MHPLKSHLRKKKQTIKEFAEQIETSPVYLSHIMAGRTVPSLRMAAKIVGACDGEVDYDDFIIKSTVTQVDSAIQK